MSRTFANPLSRNDPGVVASARAIKQWARDALTLGEDALVSVNESPAICPDTRPGKPSCWSCVQEYLCFRCRSTKRSAM